MDLFSTILVALSLCFDTFAVAICCGVEAPQINVKQMLKIAFFLTLFQTLNPLLGYLIGRQFSTLFSAFDHWIAFSLLSVVGGKMIKEGLEKGESCDLPSKNPLATWELIVLGLATSIDAFAVGLGYAFLDVPIVFGVVIISITTALVALTGSYLGKRFGCIFGHKLDIIGGAILIAIGIKTVLEHTGVI